MLNTASERDPAHTSKLPYDKPILANLILGQLHDHPDCLWTSYVMCKKQIAVTKRKPTSAFQQAVLPG